ncbi:MAG: hypothetical protein AAF581_13500 [Planctomycetota bacterium]
MTDFLVQLHASWGGGAFLALSALITLLLCFVVIPFSTDKMVDNAAGLAARLLGNRYRTLVINASTNNPEAANMIVSMAMGRFGGWANPLGSLLANLYLILLVAPCMVIGKYLIGGQRDALREFVQLLRREWRLVLWHVSLTGLTYIAGQTALNLMLHRSVFRDPDYTPALPATGALMWYALLILIVALVIWIIFDRILHRQRPELFHDIDDSSQADSFGQFLLGTTILIGTAWLMNELFLSWVQIYEEALTKAFGDAIFTGLHFILGALVTSLPEVRVAYRYFLKRSGPDLHTALGSASYSNLTNLILCVLGLVVFMILVANGVVLPWE